MWKQATIQQVRIVVMLNGLKAPQHVTIIPDTTRSGFVTVIWYEATD